MIKREIQWKKMEAHRQKLTEKKAKIGILEELLKLDEAKDVDDQDFEHQRQLRVRLRKTQSEYQNMNQV